MYKEKIKDSKENIKGLKITALVIIIFTVVSLLVLIPLYKYNVINEKILEWVLWCICFVFFYGLTNIVIGIQRNNEKIMDLQQQEIELLLTKALDKDEE